MKNIHVKPTDNPSRLFINPLWEHQLRFVKDEFIEKNKERLPQNIYITNDEEIKEGDWILNEKFKDIYKITSKIECNVFNTDKYSHIKKIIITTDQELINDGVQAIDDDFLEWFVKNPSCKEIDVIKIEDELISHKNPKIRFNALQDPPSFISAKSLNNMILTYKYKIIIPKEEPTLANMKCTCMRFEANCFSGRCKNCGFPPKEEPKQENVIITWYKEMFNKVVETLKDGHAVTFVTQKEQLGNSTLLFHFYNDKQVIRELKEILDFKHFGFYGGNTIVDIRDLFDNFIKQDWCKEILKYWDDFSLPPYIIEQYISSKRINGDVISYLDNPYDVKKEHKQDKIMERFITNAKQERSYSVEEVRELLETQRGNCYVALLQHTKNDDIASVALNAPEPGAFNATWLNQSKNK